jgi:mono/diheme cytochrome c family protein
VIFSRIIFLLILIFIAACKPGSNEIKYTTLEQRGKTVYMSVCIACHNANPTLAGSVGPDIADSSLELITMRVMSVNYPDGYKPKRQSKLMVAFPQYEKDIPAIHAYLQTFKKH